MSPKIILSAHAPVEITITHKVGLMHAVLEAGVCFGVLNGMNDQIIQWKIVIQYTEVNLNYYFFSEKGTCCICISSQTIRLCNTDFSHSVSSLMSLGTEFQMWDLNSGGYYFYCL